MHLRIILLLNLIHRSVQLKMTLDKATQILSFSVLMMLTCDWPVCRFNCIIFWIVVVLVQVHNSFYKQKSIHWPTKCQCWHCINACKQNCKSEANGIIINYHEKFSKNWKWKSCRFFIFYKHCVENVFAIC